MQYRCIKEFVVEKYNEDGFLMLGKCLIIPVGSVWEVDSEFSNMVGSTDCVHLDRAWKSKKAKSRQWLEVTKEHLAEYFEPFERKEYCSTCNYYAVEEGVCCNGDSKHRADFRCFDDYCEFWKEAE